MAFNRIKVGVAAAALLFVATPANAAFDFGDIICETTTTTGTGTLSLGGAVTNYVTFVSQIASGAVVPYHIRASNGTLETGNGTFTDATPDTLTRVADWSTDGSGAELTLPAGTHTVCVGPIASIFNGAKGFQLYTADAGAVGGVLPFWHDSASPADGDIAGEIQVWGGADDEEVGRIALEVDDGATTTEDTRWRFFADVAGSSVEHMVIVNNTVLPGSDAAIDLGSATLAWNNLHLDTGGVINFENGDVTIAHSANALAFAGVTGDYTFDDTVNPTSNDGAALGTTALGWSDLFLADGGVVNWGNGGVTTTHTAASDSLSIALDAANGLASTTYSVALDGSTLFQLDTDATFAVAVNPASSDGAALGTSALMWSDLFLASGGVINWNAANVVVTHSALALTITTADAGATGTTLTLQHDSASPADGDIAGNLSIKAGADDEEIGQIRMEVDDGATTTEDTQWQFVLRSAGADLTALTLGNSSSLFGFNTPVHTFQLGATGQAIEVRNTRTDTGGPTLALYADSSSPAAGDLVSRYDGYGEDSAGNAQMYSSARTVIVDTTSTSEDSRFEFIMLVNGTETTAFTIGTNDTGEVTFDPANDMFVLDGGNMLRMYETEANGDNYKALSQGAAITADTICTFENDANFIPDSCVGDGVDGSDGRLKDIQPLTTDAGVMLDQIKIYDYKWNTDAPEASEDIRKGKRGYGPIAQELFAINPDFVHVGGENPIDDPWTWKPEKIVPYLIAEVQNLRKRLANSTCYGLKLGNACIGVSM